MDGLRQLGLLLWLRFILTWRVLISTTAGLAVSLLALALLLPASILLGAGAYAFASSMADDMTVRYLFILVYFFWFQASMRGMLGNDFFDVSKLLPLPVNPWLSFVATFLGGLLGVGPLFMTPAFLGLSLGLDPSPAALIVRMLLYGLFLLHLIAVPRVGSYIVQWLLGFRFFRDWGLIMGLVLFSAFWLCVMYLLYSPGGMRNIPVYMARLESVIVYLPPVWFADSFYKLNAGGIGPHLPMLGFFVPLTVLCFLFAGLLHIRLASSDVLTSGRTRWSGGPRYDVSFAGNLLLEVLPLAYAWHQVKIIWREPNVRTRALSSIFSLVVPLAVFYFVSMQTKVIGAFQPYLPYIMTLLLVSSHRLLLSNILGPDGQGIVTLFGTPTPRRWIILGKNLGMGAFYFVLDVILIAALCLFYKTPEALPVCVAGLVVFLILYSGLGNIISVLAPVSLTIKGTNALRQASRQQMGCRQSMIFMVTRLLSSIVAAPFVVAFALPFFGSLRLPGGIDPWLLIIPVTLLGALVVYSVCLFIAEHLLLAREEKVMAYLLNPNE